MRKEGENLRLEVSLELEKFKLKETLARHNAGAAVSAVTKPAVIEAATSAGDKP